MARSQQTRPFAYAQESLWPTLAIQPGNAEPTPGLAPIVQELASHTQFSSQRSALLASFQAQHRLLLELGGECADRSV
jgi:hypothetical protein